MAVWSLVPLTLVLLASSQALPRHASPTFPKQTPTQSPGDAGKKDAHDAPNGDLEGQSGALQEEDLPQEAPRGFMAGVAGEDAEEIHALSKRATLGGPIPRAKRSYEGYYLQSLGYDPMLAWGTKRFDDSNRPPLSYDASRSWAKRNDDSLWSNGEYDPVSPWSTKRFDDDNSYLESIGYDPAMGWKKRTDPGLWYLMHNTHGGGKKRSVNPYYWVDVDDYKRSPSGMGANGFHEGIFNNNFGYFSPVKRGKREALVNEAEDPKSNNQKHKFGMGSSGFHSDTFNDGWGGFSTMKKRRPEWDSSGFYGDTFSSGFGDFGTMKKRRPEMTSSGFYGDTFSHGFGDFGTMKKRRPEMTSSGFYGDTFSHGFGDFGTMKKRRPEMTSSGFYGDTFSHGFGDFGTMRKRGPEMTSSGFHGDTFSHGFGDFGTMKRSLIKRRPEMTSSGFFGDTFSGGFGDFSPMKRSVDDVQNAEEESPEKETTKDLPAKNDRRKRSTYAKRRPEMTSSGFHGDMFSRGFGDFSTMKRSFQKRRPEMTSSGFHGDTFSNGFGRDFHTMRKKASNPTDEGSNQEETESTDALTERR